MRASTIVMLIVVFVGALGGIVGMGLVMRANEQAKQEITPADQIKPSLAVVIDKHTTAAAAVETPKTVAASEPAVRIEKVNTELAKPQPVKAAEKLVEKPKVEPVVEPVSFVAKNAPDVRKMGKDAQELVLSAGDAVMQGKNLRKLPGGEITGLAAHDSLEWLVEPGRPGMYTLEITYACGEKAGGVCLISAGSHEFTHAVTPTGGSEQFKTLTLGKLTLPAKPVRLTVTPTVSREGGVMTIRSIRIGAAKR